MQTNFSTTFSLVPRPEKKEPGTLRNVGFIIVGDTMNTVLRLISHYSSDDYLNVFLISTTFDYPFLITVYLKADYLSFETQLVSFLSGQIGAPKQL